MKTQTIDMEIDGIGITVTGRYYTELPATRTEPPQYEEWEWEECLIGGVSVLGAEFIDWQAIEKQIIAEIKRREDNV